MQKLCIVFIISAILTACDHGHKDQPEGSAKPESGSFKGFMSEEQTQCAGFQRAYRYLYGEKAIGAQAIGVRLRLSEDGQYELKYSEQTVHDATLKRKGVYHGTWTQEGGTLQLTGRLRGTMTTRPLLKLRVPGSRLASETREIPLVMQVEKNAWSVHRCSPNDNDKMAYVGTELRIAGQTPTEYWNQRLSPGSLNDKEFRANVGDLYEGNLTSRILLRVYSDGTFLLQKQAAVENRLELAGEVRGSWQIVDGLVKLGVDIGVIVPDSDTLQPILYLHIDPATHATYDDEAPSANIGSTGF